MAEKRTISKGEVYISKALEFTNEKKIPVPYRLRLLHAMALRSHDLTKEAAAEMEIVINYLEGKNNFQKNT